MVLFNRLGDRVDKLEKRTRRTALQVINRLAWLALAIVESVVLRDADDRGWRDGADP